MSVKFEVPEIPPQFLISYQGKPYITSQGLIYLGHLQGLKRVDAQVITAPTASSLFTLVRCEVETSLGLFSDYGSVSESNKGTVGAKYPIEMATTRARNRALRIATGCPLTSYEEMGADHEDDDDTPPPPTQQQRPPAAPPPARATTPEGPRHPQQAAPAGGSLATEPQIKAIKTLLGKLGRPIDWELLGSLTKAAASAQIQALQDALPGKGTTDQTVQIDGYRDADVAFLTAHQER